MSKVVKDGRLEALPAGREPRRQELAELARTDRKARAKLLADLYPLVERVAKRQSGLGVAYPLREWPDPPERLIWKAGNVYSDAERREA